MNNELNIYLSIKSIITQSLFQLLLFCRTINIPRRWHWSFKRSI